jgi:hypothetical protein
MSPHELAQDALARLVAAQESIEYGDTAEGRQILRDLEIDLDAALKRGAFDV